MITVDDGEIVGIGGLLDDNERRTIEKIPFLGDLPAIGNLFQSKSRARAKTNLMVFIRPTILRSSADARAMTGAPLRLYPRHAISAEPRRRSRRIDELVREYMGMVPPDPAPAPPPPLDPARLRAGDEARRSGGHSLGRAAAGGDSPVTMDRHPGESRDLVEEGHVLLPEAPAFAGVTNLPRTCLTSSPSGSASPWSAKRTARCGVALREGVRPPGADRGPAGLGRPVRRRDGHAPSGFDKLLSERYAMDDQAAADAAGSLGLGDELEPPRHRPANRRRPARQRRRRARHPADQRDHRRCRPPGRLRHPYRAL